MLTKDEISKLLDLTHQLGDPVGDPDVGWMEHQIRRALDKRGILHPANLDGLTLKILGANYRCMIGLVEGSGGLVAFEAEADDNNECASLETMSAYSVLGALRHYNLLHLVIPQEVCDELSRLVTDRDESQAASYEEKKKQQDLQNLAELLAKYPDYAISLNPA
jgi:hypothetical protein